MRMRRLMIALVALVAISTAFMTCAKADAGSYAYPSYEEYRLSQRTRYDLQLDLNWWVPASRHNRFSLKNNNLAMFGTQANLASGARWLTALEADIMAPLTGKSMVFRGLSLVLVQPPIRLAYTLTHERGHGLRHSEAGYTYDLHIGNLLWCDDGYVNRDENFTDIDTNLIDSFTGFEATMELTNHLRQICRTSRCGYADLYFYAFSKLHSVEHVLFADKHDNDFEKRQSDIGQVYHEFEAKYMEGDVVDLNGMKRAAYLHILDPYFLKVVFYDLAYLYLWEGQTEFSTPWLMPYTQMNFYPCGYSHEAGADFLIDRHYCKAGIEYGESPEGDIYGIKASITEIFIAEEVSIDPTLILARQGSREGFCVKVRTDLHITEDFRLYFQTGYKDDIYVAQERRADGFLGFRVGTTLYF